MRAPSSFLADLQISIPDTWLCLAAPVVVLGILWWLITRADRVIQHVLPDAEWERSLGWFNVRAERRAERAMRWLNYGVMILLFDSLVGILWAAKGLAKLSNWDDPAVLSDLAIRIPALGLCLFIWIVYLGCGLLPKLRSQREHSALQKYRVQQQILDEERQERQAPSRSHPALPKPRVNHAGDLPDQKRHWREFPPGS